MGEKIVIIIGMTLLAVFLPYGITMLLTGNAGAQTENEDSGIVVEYEAEGKIQTMDLEEYMIGILAAQVPYDYAYEVYKAQALIVRTNARQRIKEGRILAQDLQMEYRSDAEIEKELGKQRSKEYIEMLKKAVMETNGEILTYQGQYIDALYHSVSIGKTASAKEVYNRDVPYLVSVDSSSDVEAKDYMQTVEFSFEELLSVLQTDANGASQNYGLTAQNYQSAVTVSEKTQDGYVKKVQLGTQMIPVEEFKNKFSLQSFCFYIEPKDQKLRIVVLGKGHGLGMSQFGANQMAKHGKGYRQILKHYYQNVEISNIKQ